VPVPAAASAPAPNAAASGIRTVLVLDNGDRIEVRGTTLLGRSPSAAAGERDAQLVPVADDTRSVSKTHIAVVLGRRGVFVVDRASTNGSAVVRAGAETPLVAGQPAELQVGDVVRFGDRTLRVESA
jgi:pSer/pThr/pTyr-binding forkhead associated (FHA) protein